MGLSSANAGEETARVEPWLDVGERIPEVFATAPIEAGARRTGFVPRPSKSTGKVFRAVVTFGTWSRRTTSVGQVAAKAAQVPTPVDISPEALPQRLTQRAVAFLRALLQRAFAKLQRGDTSCEADLFASVPAVHIGDRTGFERPPALKELFPGSGGGASTAGAKIQLVWEYLSPSFAPGALVAGTLPDNKSIDTGIQVAQRGALFLFELGYFKVQALARLAEAEAYFLTRLNPQPALSPAGAGRLQRTELPALLPGESRSLVEHLVYLGAGERLAGRLIAARVPEAVVTARRRKARAQAKKRGSPPSQAQLTLLAWTLFVTHVPGTVWTAATVCQAYSLRWQVARGFKSGTRAPPLATLPTKTAAPTLGYLYGRLLLLVLVYALCPALRTALWTRQQRALSFLHLVRYLQAFADRWLQALFESTATLGLLLSHLGVSAQRVSAQAARKRPTSAHRLRQSLETQNDCIEFTIKLAA